MQRTSEVDDVVAVGSAGSGLFVPWHRAFRAPPRLSDQLSVFASSRTDRDVLPDDVAAVLERFAELSRRSERRLKRLRVFPPEGEPLCNESRLVVTPAEHLHVFAVATTTGCVWCVAADRGLFVTSGLDQGIFWQLHWRKARTGWSGALAFGLVDDDVVRVRLTLDGREYEATPGRNGFAVELDVDDPENAIDRICVRRDRSRQRARRPSFLH